MIARIWHGWTTIENADLYENLLYTKIFPAIENKKVNGYRKISLFKRPLENDVEFITMMIFDNLEAVKEFAGDDYEKSYVPSEAQKVLLKHDESSQHYEIAKELNYN